MALAAMPLLGAHQALVGGVGLVLPGRLRPGGRWLRSPEAAHLRRGWRRGAAEAFDVGHQLPDLVRRKPRAPRRHALGPPVMDVVVDLGRRPAVAPALIVQRRAYQPRGLRTVAVDAVHRENRVLPSCTAAASPSNGLRICEAMLTGCPGGAPKGIDRRLASPGRLTGGGAAVEPPWLRPQAVRLRAMRAGNAAARRDIGGAPLVRGVEMAGRRARALGREQAWGAARRGAVERENVERPAARREAV